jgi:hypothetical protein
MYYIGLDVHKKTIDANRTQWAASESSAYVEGWRRAVPATCLAPGAG